MKKIILILIALPLLVVVFIYSQMRWKFTKPPHLPASDLIATNVIVTTLPSSSVTSTNLDAPLLGETILRNYGSTNLPPENDLTLMSQLMENSLLLLKSAANRPLSANEDWAGLLRGGNAAHERFLSDEHPAMNAQGQLVDRWGTPLFFHALGGGRFAIRSAGPDQKLWTADDLQRNANGSFSRGAALNSQAQSNTTEMERPATARP